MKMRMAKIFNLLMGALAVSGCDPKADDPGMQAYRAQLSQCRKELAEKIPLIPIIGGGYLDTRYFAFNVPSVVYTDGQCGTDTFVANFYWTGEEIFPDSLERMGITRPDPVPKGWDPIPKHWLFFRVGVRLGNLKKAKECAGKHGLTPNCPDLGITYPEMDVPPDRKVIPKNYPDLEIWISEKSFEYASYVIRDWRRPDGYPRFISCSPRGGEYDRTHLTKEDYENLDFKNRQFPCQLEYSSFPIKGGAARVHTGTEALKNIVPALKALEAYLNQAIILE